MSDAPGRRDATSDDEWRRRRRIAEVFGETLPETTADERDERPAGARGDRTEPAGDTWLRDQVPPHHGS